MSRRVSYAAALLCWHLCGCGVAPLAAPDAAPIESARLPTPDVSVQIPALGPCTDAPDRTLRINSNRPITVLVHGCKASAGRFRSLAQVFAFHGEQAVCFDYDDRDSLVRSADRLNGALAALESRMRSRKLTVIGHSMGGLVARKAMETTRWSEARHGSDISLVTVSAPLAGIAKANTCGNQALRWASLGVVNLVCWGITGDNWREVTASSEFIRNPAPLSMSVQRYVKVVTNEVDTCRRRNTAGACVESDFAFSLAEQYQPVIDGYAQLTNVQVDAGHVEIIGSRDVVPRKLLAILQEKGVLPPTLPERRAALERMLAVLY